MTRGPVGRYLSADGTKFYALNRKPVASGKTVVVTPPVVTVTNPVLDTVTDTI